MCTLPQHGPRRRSNRCRAAAQTELHVTRFSTCQLLQYVSFSFYFLHLQGIYILVYVTVALCGDLEKGCEVSLLYLALGVLFDVQLHGHSKILEVSFSLIAAATDRMVVNSTMISVVLSGEKICDEGLVELRVSIYKFESKRHAV